MLRRQPGFAIVAAASLAMALGLGGAHPYWLLCVSPVVLCGAVIALWRCRFSEMPLPVGVTLGLSAYSCAQAVPLPLGLVKYLSPVTAETWAGALRPFREEITWGSLSLDPGASLREALKWFLYALVLWVAIRATREHGPRTVATVVFGSALVVAICTLAHGLAGAQKVFGYYEPTFEPARWQVGPLLNPNNLSGYLNLGAFVGLGLAFAERGKDIRWLVGAGVALLLGVSLLSGSRAGFVLVPVGFATFALVRRMESAIRRPPSASSRAELATVLLAVGAAACYGLLGANASTWANLSDTSMDKLRLVQWAWPMFRDFPVFGTGRGAFESTFPAYAAVTASDGVYTSPENFLAQWLCEWGAPVALVAALAYARCFWPRTGVPKGRLAAGAFAGVVLLLLQNLLDLGLEVPGVMLLLCWALALIWVPREQKVATRRRRRARRLFRIAVVLGGLGTGLWILALYRAREPLSSERSALREAAVAIEGKADAAQLTERLRATMRRHPAEPYFPRLGGLVAMSTASRDAMLWVSRAVERAPNDPRSHILAAEVLARRGILAQALFELRHAVELDADAAKPAGTLAAQWASRWEELRRAAPAGSVGAVVLLEASRHISRDERWELRLQVLREALKRDPGSLPVRLALLSELAWQLDKGKCASHAPCAEEALRRAKDLEREQPQSAGPVILHAGILASLGRRPESLAIFANRCKTLSDVEHVRCLQHQLRLLLRRDAEKPPGASLREVAHALARSACAVRQDCTSELIEAGDALASADDWLQALTYYERAAQKSPGFHVLLKLAAAAGRVQRFALVEASLRRAERYVGNNAQLRQRLDRARRSAQSKSVRLNE